MVSESNRRIASIPDDLCAPFHTEARDLESNLLTIYRLCAMLARKEQDLKEIAQIWGGMIGLCDTVAAVLNNLAQKHPQCGAGSYYDRVLDLRNKCNRLKTLHE